MTDIIPKNIHTNQYQQLTTDGSDYMDFQDLGHKKEVSGRLPDLLRSSKVPKSHKWKNKEGEWWGSHIRVEVNEERHRDKTTVI